MPSTSTPVYIQSAPGDASLNAIPPGRMCSLREILTIPKYIPQFIYDALPSLPHPSSPAVAYTTHMAVWNHPFSLDVKHSNKSSFSSLT